MEIDEITTYVWCDEQSFPLVIQKFIAVLEQLGGLTPALRVWLATCTWSSLGEPAQDFPFGMILSDPLTVTFHVDDRSYQARICISFFWPQGKKNDHQMAQIDLFFEDPALRASLNQYTNSAANLVWKIMQTVASIFSDACIFFTNEGNDGISGNAMRKLVPAEEFWNFDMAFLPSALVSQFLPISDGLAKRSFPDREALAAPYCWSEVPWIDQEQGSF